MAYGAGGAVSWGGGALDYAGKKKKSPLEEMYQLYNTSVEKQAGDYDDIMGKFRDTYGRALDTRDPDFVPIKAEQTQYSKSADTTRALAELQELSRTGGLNEAAQQNLRARGVSPIRAQYATAQRDMDRQRRIGGGYSPNFGAVTSKMARDQSSLIADQMDKVNANIAEMVQSGRLSAAPNYASAAQAESALAHGIAEKNTANRQEANRFNASGMFESRAGRRNEALGALQGMTNLYGTTPALSNLYGTQAMNTAQFQAGEKQRKATNQISAFGRMYGG